MAQSQLDVAVIGCGGSFFAGLVHELAHWHEHPRIRLRLCDRSPVAQRHALTLLELMVATTGRQVEAVVCDRDAALDGADHVMALFCSGFPARLQRSFAILRQHGIEPSDGETATPAAVVATMAQFPILDELAQAMRLRCPKAWLHLTANPMPRLLESLLLAGNLGGRVVGHCHGARHLRDRLAAAWDLPCDEVEIDTAGVNHFCLVTSLRERMSGRDLLAEARVGDPPYASRFIEGEWGSPDAWAFFQESGLLFGHGHLHTADFLPAWGRSRRRGRLSWPAQLEEELARPLSAGAPDGWPRRWPTPHNVASYLSQPGSEDILAIAAALSGAIPPQTVWAANIRNHGILSGLPEHLVVETVGQASAEGITALAKPPLGPVPLHWINQHALINHLSARAAVEGSRSLAVEAALLDPTLRDCDCSAGQLIDELLAAAGSG